MLFLFAFLFTLMFLFMIVYVRQSLKNYCDLTAPSRARYQATPYPDKTDLYKIEIIICIIMAFVNNYLIFKIALKIDKIHSDSLTIETR